MIDPLSIEVVDETLPSQDPSHPHGQVIDSIGYSRAFYELFEGAIYLHQVTAGTEARGTLYLLPIPGPIDPLLPATATADRPLLATVCYRHR